jgi:hypothetical protein
MGSYLCVTQGLIVRCQATEKKRIEFLVQVLSKYQNLVAQSQNQKYVLSLDLQLTCRLADGDRALAASIGAVNAEEDLAVYSAKHGIDMPFSLDAKPEEWTPAKGCVHTYNHSALPFCLCSCAHFRAGEEEPQFAAPGSLEGAWFIKMAEKHGRSHRRFFAFDERNKVLSPLLFFLIVSKSSTTRSSSRESPSCPRALSSWPTSRPSRSRARSSLL